MTNEIRIDDEWLDYWLEGKQGQRFMDHCDTGTVLQDLLAAANEIRLLQKIRSSGLAAVAFCARLDGIDDVPAEVVSEAKKIVAEWKTTDRC